LGTGFGTDRFVDGAEPDGRETDGELGRLPPNDGPSLRLGEVERLGGLERLGPSSLALDLDRFDLLDLFDLLGFELAPSERLGAEASAPPRDSPIDFDPRLGFGGGSPVLKEPRPGRFVVTASLLPSERDPRALRDPALDPFALPDGLPPLNVPPAFGEPRPAAVLFGALPLGRMKLVDFGSAFP
jgi:hypothetical protein